MNYASDGDVNRDLATSADVTRFRDWAPIEWYTNAVHRLLLTEFTNGDTPGLTVNDPFTQQPYTYNPLTPPKYQLCAVFLTASVPTPQRPAWAHTAGESCIELDASKSPAYPTGVN